MSKLDDWEEFLFEEEVDPYILELGKLIQAEDEKVHVLNEEVLKRFEMAYRLLQKAFEDHDAEITYTLHKPYKSCGAIRICGEDLIVSDAKAFALAVELIPNIDIYPLTDGRVQMDFSVSNLTTPIE